MTRSRTAIAVGYARSANTGWSSHQRGSDGQRLGNRNEKGTIPSQRLGAVRSTAHEGHNTGNCWRRGEQLAHSDDLRLTLCSAAAARCLVRRPLLQPLFHSPFKHSASYQPASSATQCFSTQCPSYRTVSCSLVMSRAGGPSSGSGDFTAERPSGGGSRRKPAGSSGSSSAGGGTVILDVAAKLNPAFLALSRLKSAAATAATADERWSARPNRMLLPSLLVVSCV